MNTKQSGHLRLVKAASKHVVPHDWEQERALIGGILMAPSWFKDVKSQIGITREDFHRPSHQNIWELMETLESPGFETVFSALTQMKDPELYGGIAYVAAMPNACPAVDTIPFRAKSIRTITVRRKLWEVSEQIREISSDVVATSDEMLAKAKTVLESTAGLTSSRAWLTIGDATVKALQAIELRRTQPDNHGIDFGWPTLTKMLGKLRSGKLWIIAARPSMGKTTLLDMCALRSASQGCGTGVISLEMDVEECTERSLVKLSGVSASKVRDGLLSYDEMLHMSSFQPYMDSLPLWIEFAPSVTLARIRGLVYQLRSDAEQKGTPLRVVFLDYLQIMGGKPSSQSENDFITEITKGLKQLAGETDISIIVLSQLNRKTEDRTDKCPTLGDLRGSGSIEQDADVVIAIDRPSQRDPNDRPGEADFAVLKARGGSVGRITVQWFDDTAMFGGEIQSTAPM